MRMTGWTTSQLA